MTTRAKPKDIVAESQKVVGVVKKTHKWAAISLAMVVAIFSIVIPLLTWTVSPSVKNQSRQQQSVLTLTMPANGDSRQIAAEKGIVPSFTGYDFDTHCVYADGSDRSMLDKVNPCVGGNIVAYYVRNLSGKPNTVTYVFVKS